ncbi:prolyl-tRNA synthetase associated domain-containing protein [Paenibacillus pinihumi]|uniref:prolyl-tRNA synthetase associated domain-containing protein n=1 Tax=Paenibacillus pinihumi TaxID=669462 RepID=UPI0004080EF6|nr:prolyl-tRNA synthetase associated domain-containing protein [Paenibacillus pinihumi]
MFFISDIFKTKPDRYLTPLHEKTYETLINLGIPFERVNTDEAITMEDCIQINQKLEFNMVKTLFLCNRQQTRFYLFITTADKQFKSKEFSKKLGIPRVSFASAEQLESMLGVKIGAATIFGILLDKEQTVQVVFDEEVVAEEWYGCSDGTTTGYLKIKSSQVICDFLTYANHIPTVIQI